MNQFISFTLLKMILFSSLLFFNSILSQPITKTTFPTIEDSLKNRKIINQLIAESNPEDSIIYVGDIMYKKSILLEKGSFDGTPWPLGKVYYSFHSNVSTVNRQRFLDACAEWSSSAPIEFIQRTTQTNYILVQDSDENSSMLGMVGGEQLLNIFNWTYKIIIAHEIAHALGAIHEHSRSDRDSYIDVISANIIPLPEILYQFDIRSFSTNFTEYNFSSMMHYPKDAFTVNLENTIVPKAQYIQFIDTMGQRTYIPDSDRMGMYLRYSPQEIQSIAGQNLEVTKPGAVSVTVSVPMAGEYYVKVFNDNLLPPDWNWNNTSTTIVPLSGGETYNFTFQVTPTTVEETFQFWLYKKTWVPGVFFVIDRVTFTLNAIMPDTEAPFVFIYNPESGATLDGIVNIRAHATDNQSGVQKVEFLVNNTSLGTDAVSPYELAWNTSSYSNGNYQLKAKATDFAGNSNTSTIPVSVYHAPPQYTNDYTIINPTATPANPLAGDQVTFRATLKNAGTATQPQGQPVKFFVDGIYKNQTTTTPSLTSGSVTEVSFTWTATQGAHNIKIQAFLTGDQNSANDYADLPLNIGVAGNLLVNGSAAPTSSITVNPNSSGNYTVTLQNTGSATINGTVSKSGNNAQWISLTSGTTFSLGVNQSNNYTYALSIPNGTAPGTYSAAIRFSYNGGSNAVELALQIKVINFVNGQFEDLLYSSSTLIDGSNRSISGLSFPPGASFTLDNYSTTSDNYKEELTQYLSDDEYKRLNKALWKIQADEQQGSASLRLSVTPGTLYKKYTADVPLTELDVIEWWKAGSNTARISLDGFVHNQNNVIWYINNTGIYLHFSEAAWAMNYSIPQSTLDLWQAGWDDGDIYFDVTSMPVGGKLYLYNNGEKISTLTISSTGTKNFGLSSSDLSTSNYFNIKGDGTNNTKLTIQNIRLKVKFFSGDPNLQVTKSLSTQSAVINENVTATLTFTNNGSNIAVDPEYNDSPLPAGLQLVSGSLTQTLSDINPGIASNQSYVIKGTEVGNYTFGGTAVQYENPSGTIFTTNFNAVSLTITGGSLLVEGTISAPPTGYLQPVGISATIRGSQSSAIIPDATVQCIITKPGGGSHSFYLIYNTSTQSHEGTFSQTDELGQYSVQIQAERAFYTSGTLTTPLSFTINGSFAPPHSLTVTTGFRSMQLQWQPPSTTLVAEPDDKSIRNPKQLTKAVRKPDHALHGGTEDEDALLTGYLIYRSDSSGGQYTLIGNTQGLQYTDQSVLQGVPYYYAVTALYANPTGESGHSNEVPATIVIHPQMSISDTVLADFGSVLINTNSETRNYVVSGSDLPLKVVISAPAGFLLNTAETGNFLPQIELQPGQDGILQPQTIYAIFRPTQALVYDGLLRHASSGAESKFIRVSGQGKVRAIYINVPNGGQSWPVHSRQSIRWQSSETSLITIEYTTNNGGSWLPIADSVSASSGQYIIEHVPNTPSTQCKVRLKNTAFPDVFSVSNSTFAITYTGYSVSGTVTYRNQAQTPLNGVSMHLYQDSILVQDTITNANGQYSFINIPNGSYTVHCMTSKPWGGVDSADIHGILRHTAMLNSIIDPYYLQAADVNQSGTITAADALWLINRLGNSTDNFPAGEWRFDKPPITVNGANLTKNITGFCTGDINGSYLPPMLRAKPEILLNRKGE